MMKIRLQWQTRTPWAVKQVRTEIPALSGMNINGYSTIDVDESSRTDLCERIDGFVRIGLLRRAGFLFEIKFEVDMEEVKKQIESYLRERAQSDPTFAKKLGAKGKSIGNCIDYIIGEAARRGKGCVMMTDAEVYSLAVHYYDEADMEINRAGVDRLVRSAADAALKASQAEVERLLREKEAAEQAAAKVREADAARREREKAAAEKRKAEQQDRAAEKAAERDRRTAEKAKKQQRKAEAEQAQLSLF